MTGTRICCCPLGLGSFDDCENGQEENQYRKPNDKVMISENECADRQCEFPLHVIGLANALELHVNRFMIIYKFSAPLHCTGLLARALLMVT